MYFFFAVRLFGVSAKHNSHTVLSVARQLEAFITVLEKTFKHSYHYRYYL